MKISHVCPFVNEQIGGSERYVYNLSKLQLRNHEVHIHTTTRHLDRVGSDEVNGIIVHKYYAPIVVWNVNPITMMIQPLMKSESDIYHIHSYIYFSSNQAIMAKILKKRKSLLQLHGGLGIPPYNIGLIKLAAKRFYDRTLGKLTITHSDLIASVSKTDIQFVKSQYGIPDYRLRYIPNMVDIDLFKPSAEQSSEIKSLLYLGDLEPWKGVGLLIKWIHAIDHIFSDEITIRFVGQGSYMGNLLNLQEHLRKSGNGVKIEILGPKSHDEIPNLLKESNALILPSYWEGLPTVVLEAMASGIPVISTPVGDIPHLIEHNKTGILIDYTLKSFKAAISAVLHDHLKIRIIVGNARKLMENQFNPAKIMMNINKVYAELT